MNSLCGGDINWMYNKHDMLFRTAIIITNVA